MITTPIMPYLPNWKTNISISYKFTTAISTTRREREQRSSMYFKPRRIITAQFLLQKTQLSRLWNFLVSIRSTVFLFPVVSEPIISTESDTIELTSPNIYPLEALTNYHNLNRVVVLSTEDSAVILYDERETVLPEGSVITEIITRATPAFPLGARISTLGWTGSFQRGKTVMYLGLPVMLVSKSKKNVTDSTAEISVVANEFPAYCVT